jgi:hypothetical protein
MASALETDPQEEFLALLCADEDLVRAEFEAIIDANWDPPRPARRTPPTPPRRPAHRRSPAPPTTPRGSVRREGRVGWRRERSPPLGLAPRIEARKGR